MAKELARLKQLDKQYDLQLADMAENLEEKHRMRIEENQRLLHEIDGIPRKREQIKSIPFLGSGGLYDRFGNNTIQDKINKAHLCFVQDCQKK